MALAQVLAAFQGAVAQCEGLIASAHRTDGAGVFLFSQADREQITVAAFLNMFIAWERFIASSLAELMTGVPTIGGAAPVKYVSPVDVVAARKLLVGVMKYFDYGNHEFVRTMSKLYFDQGYPYEQPIASIVADLSDIKIMRNSCAHTDATTQLPLESLRIRIFGQPQQGVTVYQMLTAVDPRSAAGDTVFVTYKNKLLVTAELISNG